MLHLTIRFADQSYQGIDSYSHKFLRVHLYRHLRPSSSAETDRRIAPAPAHIINVDVRLESARAYHSTNHQHEPDAYATARYHKRTLLDSLRVTTCPCPLRLLRRRRYSPPTPFSVPATRLAPAATPPAVECLVVVFFLPPVVFWFPLPRCEQCKPAAPLFVACSLCCPVARNRITFR